MGKILKCDGCGRISPDEKGSHIANHWFEITVHPRAYPDSHDYIYCPDCLGVPHGFSKLIYVIKSLLGFAEPKKVLGPDCDHAYSHDSQPGDYRFCPWCGGAHEGRGK